MVISKNQRTIGYLALCLLMGSTLHIAHACEPAAFDFDVFFQRNDINRDNFLQRNELLNVCFGEQSDILDKSIITPAAFVELDVNHDNKISRDEIWAWGQYVHNACENWPTKRTNFWDFFGF
jgi:hypothetical protein